MKIAIAQLNPIIGDLQGNREKIAQQAELAVKQEANLLLTPELSLCGYPPKDLLLNQSFVNSMANQLQKLAVEINPHLYLLVGTVTINPYASEKGEKNLYNSLALLNNGKIHHIYNKRLLPTYDVFEEDRYFEAGNKPNYLTINDIKIGLTICEDLWNDEQFWGRKNYEVNPLEDLVNLDVDLIINLSASPYSVGKQKIRESMVKHTVEKIKKPIIYVNQIGGNDDLIFDGNSFGFNQKGEIIFRAKSYESDLVIVEFEQEKEDLLKNKVINNLINDENEEIYQALVLGVKDYAQKCGFSRAVLGLSGGIDSALVAKVATDALGKNNVLGVLMPSPYSSDHSIIDAENLVNNLGINSTKIEIESAMKAYDILLNPLFSETEFGVAEENLQSRIRGNLLMAIANKFGYLLLSTGNKSEMAVGYCTLYGDMNGGLTVIADVPKTRVFSLCKWLNQDIEIIPNNILIKPPSAELKPDQKDEDSLPPYEILDDILEKYISQHLSIEEIITLGHHRETVEKVIKLVARAEFKRKQAPPGLKITPRAFGSGWKMPIASKWF